MAFIAQHVVVLPLSPLVAAPTCFWPLGARMMRGFWTQLKPLSSTLNIFDGGKLCSFISWVKLEMNLSTSVLLNSVIRLRLVGSGFLALIEEFLFKNLANQSSPALCLSLLKLFGILFISVN